MKKILLTAAFAALVATPAIAADSTRAKAKKSKVVETTYVQSQRYPLDVNAYNPEWDVYVRGEYVGTDPDPRIRWSLREEWKRTYNLR